VDLYIAISLVFSALTQRLLQPMAVGQPQLIQQSPISQRPGFPIYGTEMGFTPSNGFQSPSVMDPNANRLFQPTLQVSFLGFRFVIWGNFVL
jgi:hypothetical protein